MLILESLTYTTSDFFLLTNFIQNIFYKSKSCEWYVVHQTFKFHIVWYKRIWSFLIFIYTKNWALHFQPLIYAPRAMLWDNCSVIAQMWAGLRACFRLLPILHFRKLWWWKIFAVLVETTRDSDCRDQLPQCSVSVVAAVSAPSAQLEEFTGKCTQYAKACRKAPAKVIINMNVSGRK